jgi:hypothetical protein
MIASRNDVLRELAWAERVQLLGASADQRQEATVVVGVLRHRLHRIEDARRERASARKRFGPAIRLVVTGLVSAGVGALMAAEWPRLLVTLGRW